MKKIRKKESCSECVTGVMSLTERNEWKKKKRGTERERGPKGVGVPLAANIAHEHTHTHLQYTHMHAGPLKDTFKPKVILTPSEVLFWHLNLGQRKEIKR